MTATIDDGTDLVKARGKKREIHSGDLPVGQRAPIVQHEDGTVDRETFLVEDRAALHSSDFDLLAFNEEPVTIMISPDRLMSSEPSVYVAIQGRRAEMLVNGQFMPIGWLPTGKAITVKRKYVEVLLRSKIEKIDHSFSYANNGDSLNNLIRQNQVNRNVSLISDANPRGADWFAGCINER